MLARLDSQFTLLIKALFLAALELRLFSLGLS